MPPLGDVGGTVTLAGKPLVGAIVEYSPKETGRPSVATTDSEGYYSLLYTNDYSGAVIGDHTIQITLAEGDEEEDYTEYSAGDSGKGGGLPPSASNGSLTFKVEDGSNTNDITL
ncbi:MAG: hypothetical protein ABJZ55_12690 [Fuerstiella sp.]